MIDVNQTLRRSKHHRLLIVIHFRHNPTSSVLLENHIIANLGFLVQDFSKKAWTYFVFLNATFVFVGAVVF